MIMKKKLALSIMMVGCILTTSASAQEDDVYVDLSVLDGLSTAPIIVSGNATEPLFPIVKKAPKAKKEIRESAKVKSAIIKKEVKKNIARLNHQTPAVVSKAETKPQPQQIPYVESKDPIVVVDVEPAKATTETNFDAAILPTNQKEEASIEPISAANDVEKTANVPANKTSELLVNENIQQAPGSNGVSKLVFAEGTDTLTEEHKAQIDAIIASFDDALVNKIAIYSYNLDNGVDAFKKKRLSLNRAVEVRSYLLPKGYKNFSIKVVNVDAAPEKANTVEIEELKN